MSEPVPRPNPDDEEPTSEGLMSQPQGPLGNPTGVLYNTIQMCSNTGIVLLGGAALLLCLWRLHQAFILVTILLIALGIVNLVLLGLARREETQLVAARVAEAALYTATVQAATAAANAAAEAARLALANYPGAQARLDPQRRQATGS